MAILCVTFWGCEQPVPCGACPDSPTHTQGTPALPAPPLQQPPHRMASLLYAWFLPCRMASSSNRALGQETPSSIRSHCHSGEVIPWSWLRRWTSNSRQGNLRGSGGSCWLSGERGTLLFVIDRGPVCPGPPGTQPEVKREGGKAQTRTKQVPVKPVWLLDAAMLEASFSSRSSRFRSQCLRAHALQSCPTLCDPRDCSPPGSSVRGIIQARILEWVAMPFSRGSSQPGDLTRVSCISCLAGGFLTTSATGEALMTQWIPFLAEASLSWVLLPAARRCTWRWTCKRLSASALPSGTTAPCASAVLSAWEWPHRQNRARDQEGQFQFLGCGSRWVWRLRAVSRERVHTGKEVRRVIAQHPGPRPSSAAGHAVLAGVHCVGHTYAPLN